MVNLKEKDIQNILRQFRERTDVLCSTLFTEDGFIIAVDQAHLNINEDYHQSIGAICAAIVALAEDYIETMEQNQNVKQISIQGGDQVDNEGFIIILKPITEYIRLSIIFPFHLNLGVILFELNQTIQKLIRYLTHIEQIDMLERASTFL